MISRMGPSLAIGILAIAVGLTTSAKAAPVPESCPVTKPFQSSLFVPPYPYPEKAFRSTFWFGSDRLWTELPAVGMWKLGNHPADRMFGQKLAFWREGYDARTKPRPPLKITGRRLDSPAIHLVFDGANGSWEHTDQPFIMTGVDFPTLGCWEITARYEADELTFVIWIAK